jgi:hypothetical protein
MRKIDDARGGNLNFNDLYNLRISSLKKFSSLVKNLYLQPAAQTRIEKQRFLPILGVFPQFVVILQPKKPIFLEYFPICGPGTNLGWPPLI